jgi:hypothetical protein
MLIPLVSQRTAISADKLLYILARLMAEAADWRSVEQLRIAIWRAKGEPNWQARIADDAPSTATLTIFCRAVDRAAKLYDLDDDPVYHEATCRMAA